MGNKLVLVVIAFGLYMVLSIGFNYYDYWKTWKKPWGKRWYKPWRW